MTVFLKGLAFGFLLAAAVGPMWLLCLRRTLASGARAGIASGMGVAAADGFYGAVAAFGLTAISGFLLGYNFWLGLAGGAFLLYLGLKTMLARPVPPATGEMPAQSLTASFLSTLGLTLANPPTILAFAAIFAGLGLVSGTDYGAAALIVGGVFFGSALWWVILAAAASRLRHRMTPRFARGISVMSGATILAFAAWQLAALFR